jgi:sulfur carrier protein
VENGVNITVNGRDMDVSEGIRISDLLTELDVPAGATAVEVNKTIVPRAEHPDHLLQEGDRIEIVTFVGGG